jgi:TolA-binding protein
MTRWTAIFWVPFVCLGGCAYYSQEDGERLNTELFGVTAQLAKLREEMDGFKKADQEKSARLDKVVEETGVLSKSARRNDADLGVQLDAMMEDVARIKGQVESVNERVSVVEAGYSKVQDEVDVRFDALAEADRIQKAATEGEKKKVIGEAKARDDLLSNPSKLFAEAERRIRKGEEDSARKLLREFMIRSKEPKHLSKAQYLIGNSLYSEKKYQKAAAEFNAVRKKYPKSAEVPLALYHLGRCFEALKFPKEDAKVFYQTVVQAYGKSSVAKDAQQRLDALK